MSENIIIKLNKRIYENTLYIDIRRCSDIKNLRCATGATRTVSFQVLRTTWRNRRTRVLWLRRRWPGVPVLGIVVQLEAVIRYDHRRVRGVVSIGDFHFSLRPGSSPPIITNENRIHHVRQLLLCSYALAYLYTYTHTHIESFGTDEFIISFSTE